jgi:hypothetical protein
LKQLNKDWDFSEVLRPLLTDQGPAITQIPRLRKQPNDTTNIRCIASITIGWNGAVVCEATESTVDSNEKAIINNVRSIVALDEMAVPKFLTIVFLILALLLK